MAENDKKRSLEERPDLTQMRAFTETAFPVWLKRMPGEQIAKLVGELSIRWTTAGHNVLTVAGAIHAELGVQPEVDQVLDLVVAWEEINNVRYDPGLGRFVKREVKVDVPPSSKSSHKSKTVARLEKKLLELEDQVKLAEKRALRLDKNLEYLDRLFVVETVTKFKDRKEGLAEWMLTALELVEGRLRIR